MRQPDTEMQSMVNEVIHTAGAVSESRFQRNSTKAARQAPERVSSFMGIMDFIQPDDMGNVFAEMGVNKAAPVPIPVEKPKP